MTPRLLRSFVVLAAELHFGRAAERLLIAQPALSQQIKALERELGVPLFERSRRHVALTPAGKELLEHATDLLARTDAAVVATRLAGRGLRGRLRIAHTRSAPGGVAREIVERFRAEYPDVELDLRVGHTARNVEELLAGQVDAAFAYPPVPGLRTLTVGWEPLAVALPADHALAGRPAVDPADLRTEPVVSWPRANGPGLHDGIVAAVWGAASDGVPNVVREEPDEAHMLRAVAAGIGLAVCVGSAVGSVSLPGLVVRPFAAPGPAVELALAYRADDDPGNPVLPRLLAVAAQEAGRNRRR